MKTAIARLVNQNELIRQLAQLRDQARELGDGVAEDAISHASASMRRSEEGSKR